MNCVWHKLIASSFQVFYLDNLDFGPLNIKHQSFPRIVNTVVRPIKVRMNLDFKEKDLYKPTQFGKLQVILTAFLFRPKLHLCTLTYLNYLQLLRKKSDVYYNLSRARTMSAAPGPSEVIKGHP